MIAEKKNEKKRVMVAGHICLDITPAFPMQEEESVEQLLAPGRLINVGRPDIHPGGAVSNTGLALQYFGADVSLAGRVGKDEFGRIIRQKMDGYGCTAKLNEDSESGTSYSIVIAVPGTDRIFLHNPGSNNTFCADDITDEMLKDIDHFHFGYPTLMARMYENEGQQLENLFLRVKDKGLTTSLDMASIDSASPAGKVNWEAVLSRVLPLTDFFVPSAGEIGFMLDRRRYDEWNRKSGGGDIVHALQMKDLVFLGSRLTDLGAGVVMIKCGERGIYYCAGKQERIQPLLDKHGLNPEEWHEKSGFAPAFLPDKVVSATGAGDTCIAAFLTAMLSGASFESCVTLAAAAGASCVSAYDALSGLRPLKELQERINAGWEKSSVL